MAHPFYQKKKKERKSKAKDPKSKKYCRWLWKMIDRENTWEKFKYFLLSQGYITYYQFADSNW